MRNLLFLISLLIIASCSDNDRLKENVKNNPKERIENTDFNNFIDLFEKVKIINLQTTEESLIGSIETLICVKETGDLIIFDKDISKNILVFDSLGIFKGKIKSFGDGPGEIKNPLTIAYDNGRIAVYTDQFKLLYFDLNCLFIEEINFVDNKLYFLIDKMVIRHDKLYAYSNNNYYNSTPKGDKNRVIKLEKFTKYAASFGTPENTYDFEGGDIIFFEDRIIFSGVFDGNLYEINENKNTTELFCTMGTLTDTKNIEKSNDHIKYILDHISDIHSIWQLGVIDNLLFAVTNNSVSIIDKRGNFVLSEIPWSISVLVGFEGLALRKGFGFYNEGIIIASTQKSRISQTDIPNPSIIFLKLKSNIFR